MKILFVLLLFFLPFVGIGQLYMMGVKLDPATHKFLDINFNQTVSLKDNSINYYATGLWVADTVKPKSSLNFKKMEDQIFESYNRLALRDSVGVAFEFKNENDLLNLLDANGYDFVSKTDLLPVSVSRFLFVIKTYKFKRK